MSIVSGEAFFSFVSPYAWKAAVVLERRDGISWTPFWAPTGPEIRRRLERRGGRVLFSPMPMEKVFYGLFEFRRRAARDGATMALPRDRNVGWDLPHLAFLEARRNGRDREFLMRAFDARWTEGLDITNVGTLVRLFDSVGLDGAIVPSMSDDEALCDEAAEGLSRAYRNGVFGVPFFVGRHETYWGVDRMSDFVLDLQSPTDAAELTTSVQEGVPHPPAVADPPPEVVEAIGIYDYDHPGGCG